MKYLSSFTVLIFSLTLVACESRPINTAQPLRVEVIGTDDAYCVLSTKYNRYQIYAPHTLMVERSAEDLKIDCTGSASRRRVITVVPEFAELYYRYPDKVTVDFSVVEGANRYNGFRAETPAFETMIKEVVTEDSFSKPIKTEQAYPVKKDYAMGRRSYPVSLD